MEFVSKTHDNLLHLLRESGNIKKESYEREVFVLNLLREIAVTGTVNPTHARLSMQFTFHNPTAHPLSPTYFFPLPEGAFITGMQLLTKEKTLLRAEIVSLTGVDTNQDGFRLIQLDSQLYSLSWECLPSGDTCTVIIECLLHLLPQKGRCRLVLPFGIPLGSQRNPSPCPANLDLILNGVKPMSLSPSDSYDEGFGTFSSTTHTNADFVLDLLTQHSESCGLLQEEFGKGCGFARLSFPVNSLAKQSNKPSILLLLDLSHSTSLRIGNALKELFFRMYSSIPEGTSVTCLTTEKPLPKNLSCDELYQHLQALSVGTGSLEDLLQSASGYQTNDAVTILFSDGSYLPSFKPGFPITLATVGAVRHTVLSHGFCCNHLHFYPNDHQEKELPGILENLLSINPLVEVIPQGGNVYDCTILSQESIYDGYLDLAFSYTGHPPQGFALWQDGQKKLSVPLLQTKILPRFPDAEQLFAITKIRKLSELLEKATPVSGRSIKKELAQLQTNSRILGSETLLILPTDGTSREAIPTRFYSSVNGLAPLSSRPTIFGDGVRALAPTDRDLLSDRCRRVIYDSIRSDGSIHSPLGITPHVSAEETALSYLALLADGKTDSSILQDALSYLKSAPETPWSFLIQSGATKSSLQKLLPSLPAFETLLDSLGNSLPLMTANYLLLWISLM